MAGSRSAKTEPVTSTIGYNARRASSRLVGWNGERRNAIVLVGNFEAEDRLELELTTFGVVIAESFS